MIKIQITKPGAQVSKLSRPRKVLRRFRDSLVKTVLQQVATEWANTTLLNKVISAQLEEER